MKRFFFRSSTPNNIKNNSLPVTDHQVYREDEGECGHRHNHASKRAQYSSQSVHSEHQNPVAVNQCLETNSALRRCHSFSSGVFLASGMGQGFCDSPSDSPSSSGSSVQIQSYNHKSRRHAPTPEKPTKAKRFDDSSNSSSNESNKVLDLYIDGEQHHESTGQTGKASQKDRTGKGAGNRPPRVQYTGYTAPSSPTGSIREKPNFNSLKCSKGMQQYFSPKDWVESGVEHDFSQDLAKRVVERLAQSHLKNQDPDVPISIEDVYAGSLDGKFGSRSTEIDQKVCCPSESENDGTSKVMTGDETDATLRSKLREVEQKIYSFSSELEQESFLEDVAYNVPEPLVHKIRILIKEKTSLALEVSAALRNHIDERSVVRKEFNSQLRRLEREKTELLSTLEKELDRRSSDWSYKLEKFQEEERRLRQRAKELAEQNVSLQREVSSLSEKEKERSNIMVHSDEQIKELSTALEATRNENQELRHHFCELQEKFRVTKEERDLIRSNYQVKEDECKDLHRSITRFLRTCSEQEKTIDGLNGVVGESIERKQPRDKFEKHVHKLEIEQVRLVGVEQSLRREVESYKHEVWSLRNENINLLNRLKACGKDGGSLTFKLDQELSARLRCLQTQGLSMLAQSTNLCSQLLEHVKGRIEVKGCNLDGQFIIDCDVKIQGLRRGAESLSRSLQTVSSVFDEKSTLVASESQTQNKDDDNGFSQPNEQLQNLTRYKLKAEMLLTNVLQEKLYAKELEFEQLQAELATAVRGTDFIRCKLQNALDTVSSTTHKMKELELQMLKCNEKLSRRESDLEECTKELGVVKGILPKVTEERDMMWKEVKQYSEKNMLLNTEAVSLKKRIEGLEEELLLKEGQITILKDSMGKPFDLLSNSDHTEEFELE